MKHPILFIFYLKKKRGNAHTPSPQIAYIYIYTHTHKEVLNSPPQLPHLTKMEYILRETYKGINEQYLRGKTLGSKVLRA
jgi:hypothetical protein